MHLQIATHYETNFPSSYTDQTGTYRPLAGIAFDFVVDPDRVRQCSHLELHMRDRSMAISAKIVAVEASDAIPGRYNIFYAHAESIAPAPHGHRNSVHYAD